MEQLLEQHTSDEIASNEIDHWIDELVAYAHNKLEERSKDYDYVFTNKETLRNVILDLFDTCYLAFDEGETNGE